MKIRSFLILIAIICVCLAIYVWLSQRGKIFVRQFGAHTLQISENVEIDEYGNRHRIFQVSYFDPPQLMYPSRPFRVEDKRMPEFKVLTSGDLVCLFDDLGLGFLVMVDQSNHDWFVTSTESHTGGESPKEFEMWRKKYHHLKDEFPELPYQDYFNGDESIKGE